MTFVTKIVGKKYENTQVDTLYMIEIRHLSLLVNTQAYAHVVMVHRKMLSQKRQSSLQKGQRFDFNYNRHAIALGEISSGHFWSVLM